MKETYKITKTDLFVYILFIVMIANDAFFTWVGMIFYISIWRQLLTIFGFLLVYRVLKRNDLGLAPYRLILKQYGLCFVIIICILSLITFVLLQFNIVRIVYSWWSYAFGLPFILFPYIARKSGWSRRKIDYLFTYLGLFLSAGILTDYMLGGFFTKTFLLAVTQGEGSFEAGRYCFLSSAPTIFSIYYCLCMMCCMHAYKYENGFLKKSILLFCAFFFIFGSIFCGSRQTLVALLLVFTISFFSTKVLKGLSLITFTFTLVILYFFMPSIQNVISSNEAVETRYSIEAIEEDRRSDTWEKGLKACITDPTVKRIFIGDGIGYTYGQKASRGEVMGTHYENTFFSRICEMGWFLAFFMLLFPVYYIVKKRKLVGTDSYMYLSLCVAYIFICCISPNGGSNTAQMALFITLGLFIEDAKERRKKTKMA